MTIQRIILLLLLAGLGGCVKLASHPCPGANPGVVPINLFYNSTTTFAAPPIKIAHPGDVLKFKLLGAPNVNVAVDGKMPVDAWVKGSGNKKQFYVCVPADLDHPHDYNYSVDPDGSPLLDPVVRIL